MVITYSGEDKAKKIFNTIWSAIGKKNILKRFVKLILFN